MLSEHVLTFVNQAGGASLYDILINSKNFSEREQGGGDWDLGVTLCYELKRWTHLGKQIMICNKSVAHVLDRFLEEKFRSKEYCFLLVAANLKSVVISFLFRFLTYKAREK